MAEVRGNPDRLEEYTQVTLPSLDRVREVLDAYRQAVAAFNALPNDLGTVLVDHSAQVEETLMRLRLLDETPAAFGQALRALDATGGVDGVLTVDAAAARRHMEQADRLPEWLVAFLFGDVLNFWSGGEEGFPVGSLTAAEVRVFRTVRWVNSALRYGQNAERTRRLFPTFNTGLVGRGLTAAGSRVPIPQVASAARWLQTPGATTVFRRAGFAGGAVGSVVGIRDLIRQGNMAEAYEREGAGYVADVAETAFSASSTAFFAFPNPYTGALVVATGLVWAGAEIVDHWDDIVEFGDDMQERAEEAVVEYVEDVTDAFRFVGNAIGF